MLDLGWTELAVIAVIALLVIGPKDLPKVLRTLGHWTRRLRGLAREFQGHVDEVIRESELEDVRDGIQKARRTNIGQSINRMVDPDGSIGRDLNDIGRDRRRRPATGGTPDAGSQSRPLDHTGAGDPTGPSPTSAPDTETDTKTKTKTDED